MTYLDRMLYHQDAAFREDQAASRAVDGMCAQLHEQLAKIHRSEAAHLEAVDTTLRQAFGDTGPSVQIGDDGTLRTFPPSMRSVGGEILPHSRTSTWPDDMG